MDQNQQNIIKPTNHKKLGLFLVGIFEFREEHNKIKLANTGLQNVINVAHDTKMM